MTLIIVQVREVHVQDYLVDTESMDTARKDVFDGKGIFIDGTMVYSHRASMGTWTLRKPDAEDLEYRVDLYEQQIRDITTRISMTKIDVMIVDLDLSIRGDWSGGVKERLTSLIKLIPLSTISKEYQGELIGGYQYWIDVIDGKEDNSIDGRSISEFRYDYVDTDEMRKKWDSYDYEYYKLHTIYNKEYDDNEEGDGSSDFYDYYYFNDGGWSEIVKYLGIDEQ